MEEVRLVIWDLDETFWKGTLTEGGYVYSRKAHDIVITLCKRGIMSSICSKNDRSVVEKVLRDEGIWDYFIFPSINWSPKGQRIQSIIDEVKLRPATVLFVDDNPMNRAEVQQLVEGIRVSDETVIPTMLTDPQFTGKNDEALSRLQQYKVMEQKRLDQAESAGDNVEFLKNSEIRVYIEHDVEKNMDRAVELINRTNQLNFTKVRLSDDEGQAKAELLKELSGYDVNAGLVYAADRYGDYGCIGFYLMKHREGFGRRLSHYCFSCRTLGMNIETWLFQRLNKPTLSIIGEVLTDILNPKEEVNWISEVRTPEDLKQKGSGRDRLSSLIIRGGCDVRAIEHYIEGLFDQSLEEMNTIVNGVAVRTDHSIFLHYALEGISPEGVAASESLCFKPEHFSSALTTLKPGQPTVALLSLWSDGRIPLYKDRNTGVALPVTLGNFKAENLLSLNVEEFEEKLTNEFAHNAAKSLRDSFEYFGPIAEDQYEATITKLVKALPQDCFLIFIQTPEFWYKGNTDERFNLVREPRLNKINIVASSSKKHVAFLNPHDFAEKRSEYLDFFHFSRPVYHRIALAILAELRDFEAATREPAQIKSLAI